MAPGDTEKILVMRFSSLGDLVLIVPLIRALKRGFPARDIHLTTKDLYEELFATDRNITRVHTLRGSGLGALARLWRELARERFDIIIDAHNVIRSNILLHALHAPRKVQLRKDQTKKLLLIKAKRNLYPRRIHQTERYLELAGRLGIPDADLVGSLDIPETTRRSADGALTRAGFAGGRLVAVAPGARWDTKRWPASYYSELIGALSKRGHTAILIGSAGETGLAERIASASGVSPLNLAGKLSLMETAALLARCEALVTNDSAPLHLAESVGTPVIAFFGPTVREFGYYPRLSRSVLLETDLECRPCSRNGAKPCPLGTKECLMSIMPADAVAKIEEVVDAAAVGG
jgi:heptosyltransferase-2